MSAKIVVLLVGLFLAGAIVFIAFEAQKPAPMWPSERFSSENWKSTPAERRYVFFNDIVEREILIGMTRDEVESLLGPAESKGLNVPVIGYKIYESAPNWIAPGGAETQIRLVFDANGKVIRITRESLY